MKQQTLYVCLLLVAIASSSSVFIKKDFSSASNQADSEASEVETNPKNPMNNLGHSFNDFDTNAHNFKKRRMQWNNKKQTFID